MRRLIAVCTTGLLTLLLSFQAAANATDRRADTNGFDSQFRATLTEHGVPGGAYAIVQDGRILRIGTFGVRRVGSQAAITPDTVFRTASVSKTFAGQLTAMLVQEGRMRWEDPVVQFLPEFRLQHPTHAQSLQIQHLLSQSTGIVPNAYDNLLNANTPLERILPHFASLEPLCEPGSCYTYQNVLFGLVGPAIEQSTGQAYEDLLAERLFRPLGMDRTTTGREAFLAEANRASPHIRRARGVVWQPVEVAESYYLVPPAAGVNASVTDLARWLIAQKGHRPDVINPALSGSLKEKRVRTIRDLRRGAWRDLLTDAHYGLGWRIYTVGQEDLFMHSGWVRGFVADISYSQERQIGLVVLLNGESRALSEITTAFWGDELSRPAPSLLVNTGTDPLELTR